MPKKIGTPRQLTLITPSQDIADRRAEPRDAAYMVRELLLCTLPHRRPPEDRFWRRTVDGATLLIQAGMRLDGSSTGIPFGVLPRLLLYWLVGEATRTKSPHIELLGQGENARSYAAFVRELGLDADGSGKRSDKTRLRETMTSLFNARIKLAWDAITIGNYERDAWSSFEIASEQMVWWDKKSNEMGEPAYIELGDRLFEAIQRSAVPCDIRALQALSYSPMALDLYGLLNYFGANLMERPHRLVTWAELQRRLGTGYSDLKNFARAVRETLPGVLAVHPGLHIEVLEEGGGLKVYPSEPAIPRREA